MSLARGCVHTDTRHGSSLPVLAQKAKSRPTHTAGTAYAATHNRLTGGAMKPLNALIEFVAICVWCVLFIFLLSFVIVIKILDALLSLFFDDNSTANYYDKVR